MSVRQMINGIASALQIRQENRFCINKNLFTRKLVRRFIIYRLCFRQVLISSEALLIGNKNMSEEKKEILDELLFRMNAVKTAEDKKYVLMNAPKDRLDEIIAVLPGMKSPTVMPLAQEGWCSVHTVLDEKCFWEIIGKLKALGAEGILVLPIEKMIL